MEMKAKESGPILEPHTQTRELRKRFFSFCDFVIVLLEKLKKILFFCP